MGKKSGWLFLFISFCLVFIMPNIGAILKWGGMPPGYGIFPAQLVGNKPGFSEPFFIAGCIVGGIILLFLFFPTLFGFKKPTVTPDEPTKKEFPPWFWPSVIVTLVSWALMWGRLDFGINLDHFSFVPLWWGFILVLDGIVYYRTGGQSLVATRMTTMKLLAAVSCLSWFVFEYLNFFVLENWYYPNNKILTNFGNIAWQAASYTTVLPAIFEWYCLLNSFKKFPARYSEGPKIAPNKITVIILWILGVFSMGLMGYYPYQLFFMLWVCLIPILVPAMSITGRWSPFTEVAKGNYSPIVVIATATLLNGFFWEFWNFGSEWFHDYAPTNPNYWKFLPYLDFIHIFSEMPILGYFGYMFFGVVCWVMWLIAAYLIKFDPAIDNKYPPAE